MVNLEKITFRQVVNFCKAIELSSSRNLKTIKRWYNAESANFEDTLSFLQDLELIKHKKNSILLSEALKRTKFLDINLKSLLRKELSKQINSEKYFGIFLDNFKLSRGLYLFTPNLRDRLRFSGTRNFLIELEMLKFDSKSNTYYLSKQIHLSARVKKLSARSLLKQLKREQEIGYIAEILIFEKEKKKFQDFPDVQKKIEHVSLVDTTAGYDIKSFDNLNKRILPKYIEVKAVSEEDWKFYWSRNEIDTAKKFHNNYYLYLVPMEDSKPKENLIKIINDPYFKIYKNKDWKKEIELLSFSLI